jgi:hypothetical protein
MQQGRLMGGQGQEFSQILAVWLVSVSYQHRPSVVGILVGIFGTVLFGRNPGCLAGIGKFPAPALGGWYFGWYFWYCTFQQEPSFDESAETPFLKNSAGTLLHVSHRVCRYIGRTYFYLSIYLSLPQF